MRIVRNPSPPSLSQLATVLAVLVGWFALSNHCVLGAPAAQGPQEAKGCPMHMSSGNAPIKQKESSADFPCCKTLRAVTTAKIAAGANTIDFVLREYFPGAILPRIAQTSGLLLALDTGPPGALSFSESVLQRSILAHAPPLVA